MDRAILGLCADKLLVFVTHDLDQAAQMDTIIYLKGRSEAPSVLSQAEFITSLDELRTKIKNPYEIQDGPNEPGLTS